MHRPTPQPRTASPLAPHAAPTHAASGLAGTVAEPLADRPAEAALHALGDPEASAPLRRAAAELLAAGATQWVHLVRGRWALALPRASYLLLVERVRERRWLEVRRVLDAVAPGASRDAALAFAVLLGAAQLEASRPGAPVDGSSRS